MFWNCGDGVFTSCCGGIAKFMTTPPIPSGPVDSGTAGADPAEPSLPRRGQCMCGRMHVWADARAGGCTGYGRRGWRRRVEAVDEEKVNRETPGRLQICNVQVRRWVANLQPMGKPGSAVASECYLIDPPEPPRLECSAPSSIFAPGSAAETSVHSTRHAYRTGKVAFLQPSRGAERCKNAT